MLKLRPLEKTNSFGANIPEIDAPRQKIVLKTKTFQIVAGNGHCSAQNRPGSLIPTIPESYFARREPLMSSGAPMSRTVDCRKSVEM